MDSAIRTFGLYFSAKRGKLAGSMGRYLAICMLPFLLLWSVSKWRAIRRAKTVREKSFHARLSLAGWIWSFLFIFTLCFVRGTFQMVLAGVLLFLGLSLRRASRLYLARMRTEEADPLMNARQVN